MKLNHEKLNSEIELWTRIYRGEAKSPKRAGRRTIYERLARAHFIPDPEFKAAQIARLMKEATAGTWSPARAMAAVSRADNLLNEIRIDILAAQRELTAATAAAEPYRIPGPGLFPAPFRRVALARRAVKALETKERNAAKRLRRLQGVADPIIADDELRRVYNRPEVIDFIGLTIETRRP